MEKQHLASFGCLVAHKRREMPSIEYAIRGNGAVVVAAKIISSDAHLRRQQTKHFAMTSHSVSSTFSYIKFVLQTMRLAGYGGSIVKRKDTEL